MASLTVIAKYLALFQELYPTRDITTLTAEAWEYALSDIGDRGFMWAADRLLKEPGRTWFPTPNEIRAHMHTGRGRVTEGPSRLTAAPDTAEPISAAQAAEWQRVKESLKP